MSSTGNSHRIKETYITDLLQFSVALKWTVWLMAVLNRPWYSDSFRRHSQVLHIAAASDIERLADRDANHSSRIFSPGSFVLVVIIPKLTVDESVYLDKRIDQATFKGCSNETLVVGFWSSNSPHSIHPNEASFLFVFN